MKKFLTLMLLLALMAAPCFAQEIVETPEGWVYLGYAPGGVSFLVPDDLESQPLSDKQQEAGVIVVSSNMDCTLTLRCFPPEFLTWEDLLAMVQQEPNVEVTLRGEAENILCYRNTVPTANVELYGIALTGLDGNLYKLSIFTGVDGDFSEDAPVWDIAEFIAQNSSQVDFSQWPLPDASES